MTMKIIFLLFFKIFKLNIKKIDKNNRILLSLRLQSVREVVGKSMEEKDHNTCCYDHGSANSSGLKKVTDFYNPGGKHGEGNTHSSLDNAYHSLGNLKKNPRVPQPLS